MSLGEMVLNVCDSPSHPLLSDKAQWFKKLVYVCLPLRVVCLCVCLDILGKLESIDIKY